jgi:hypothetical protein
MTKLANVGDVSLISSKFLERELDGTLAAVEDSRQEFVSLGGEFFPDLLSRSL